MPFTADAEVDAGLRTTSIYSDADTTINVGHTDASKDTVSLRVHEETPLLPRAGRDPNSGAPPESDPDGVNQKWWRRPSVSSELA